MPVNNFFGRERMTNAVQCFLLLSYITSLLSIGTAVENGGVINVNLSSFNSSKNVFKKFEVLHGSATVRIEDIPYPDFGYLIVQVHSFRNIISLSNRTDFSPDFSVNGTNIGLVYFVNDGLSATYYIEGDPKRNMTILLAIIGYNMSAPIPGGCNLTFDVEIAPFQKIVDENYLVRVDAQAPALNDGYCPEREIQVDMYHMYLAEWDLSEKGYFVGISKMLTVKDTLANGKKVSRSRGFPSLRQYYAAYIGTGRVFGIVTSHRGVQSVYVPAVSYGPDTTFDGDGLPVYWKIIYGFMVFFGLFMCFGGSTFFQTLLFFTGFFVAATLTYIFLSFMGLSDEGIVIAFSVVGVMYGIFWVVLWWKFGIPILSVILSFLLTGFIIASLFFYIGLADLAVFQNDINYWSVMIGIMLLVTLALLIFSHFCSNIVVSSFLGAFIAILPFDYYIGGNIRYIFLNTIYRAVVNNFSLAVVDPPVQSNDYNLLISWALLTLIGSYAQAKRSRGRAPFPSRPRLLNENTPLLSARFN